MQKHFEKILVRGLVVPSKWDKDGKVVGVTIKTFDEDEYDVSDIRAIKELLAFLRTEVIVKGTVESNKGKKFLTICELHK